MAGSTYGKIFTVSTWGESHGAGLGVVIDGCPAGLSLCEDDIQKYLDRRKPGQNAFSTQRSEADRVQILSGVFEGKTTGCPISCVVFNQDQKSKDYSAIKDVYRPGHADFCFDEKFGLRDYRGGGRSSGRETIGRVIGGAIAAKALEELGITLCAYTRSVGPHMAKDVVIDKDAILRDPLYMPDPAVSALAASYLKDAMEQKDSVGSSVECVISGMPAGIGEPVFDKLDARLAQSIMSIGAVKAVEIGDGVAVALAKGSENNDSFVATEHKVTKLTNHAGGILGGISDGSDILVRASFKPTPSIYKKQQTVTKNGDNTEIEIVGRHDPIIGPRAVVVVESMCAITVFDLLLQNLSARMEHVTAIYGGKH